MSVVRATRVAVDGSADAVSVVLSAASGVPSLSRDVVWELAQAVTVAESSGRRLELRSEGRAFCAGMDMSTLDEDTDASLVLRFIEVELMLQRFRSASVSITCVLDGPAVGAGADLAAACSSRLGTSSASFRFPGLQFGVLLGTGHLARLVGERTARDIVAGGRAVRYTEALELGLLTGVVEPDVASVPLDRAVAARAVEVDHHFDRLRSRHDDEDLAALVRSAAVPGLKERFTAYRDAAAEARRSAPR